MTVSLNSVTLVGTISQYGVKQLASGKATCAVQLTEIGRDEQEHVTYVNVEVWGKAGAPLATAMLPGTMVLVQGEVKPRKTKDVWTFVVSTRALEHLIEEPEEAA
jgi:single-stranded DNA-binding protein